MRDRAVSTVVSYVLALAIVALLLSALTISFAPLVTSQQTDAAHSTLEVLANDVAGDVQSADRLVDAAGDDGTVVLRTSLPDRVQGSPYEIQIEEVDDSGPYEYEIVLHSIDHEMNATATVRTETELSADEDGLDGGPLEISYDGNALVIEND